MISPAELDNYILGQTADALPFDSLSEIRDISTRMLNQAHRRLVIFSRVLDPPVFDQAPFLEGLKQLAISSPQARIQVLLQDNETVVKHGHRLVELARRLSSVIELRKPHPDYLNHPENFMLVDNCGVVYRPLATRYQGTANFHNPLENRRLIEFFAEAWETGERDPELKRLYL